MESYPNIPECCDAVIEWLEDDTPFNNQLSIELFTPLVKMLNILRKNGFQNMVEFALYLNSGKKMWKNSSKEFFTDVKRRNKFFTRHKNLHLLLDHNS